MDPNANIREQRELAARLIERIEACDADFNIEENASRLAELVVALDEWRTKGGFAPAPSRESDLREGLERVRARGRELERIPEAQRDQKWRVETDALIRAERASCNELRYGPRWNFWLPDEDRSTGWTNHGYVLQFVCAGYGHTPEEAWESAKRGDAPDCGVPEDFELPEGLTAIRDDAERSVTVE